MRNELTEINKLLHWINRAKDVLANQSENLPLIQGLSELGVENLANQLTEFKDFYKEDAVRFLNKNRDSIYALLKLISSPDNKLKPSAYSLEYIEGLLKEVDNIKVPEENQHLIQELHGILDRGRNWLLQYQKLKQVERKKKSKAAKKGRGRRPNPKKEEHKERDISEAKESERQEVSVIDIEERKEDNEAEEEEKIQEEGDVKEEGEGEGEAEGEAEGEEPAEKIEEKIEEKQEDGANQDQAQKIDDSEAPENVEVKSEVKEEAEVEKAKVEAEKTKQLYARDSDNFFYFFKLPLFLAAFYDGLDAKVPIEDLKNIKNYLIEINVLSL